MHMMIGEDMERRTVIRERLEYHQNAYAKLQEAYLALLEGGTQSYRIDDRSLTKLDLETLHKEIEAEERTIDELEAMLNGGRARKAFGVLPRDW